MNGTGDSYKHQLVFMIRKLAKYMDYLSIWGKEIYGYQEKNIPLKVITDPEKFQSYICVGNTINTRWRHSTEIKCWLKKPSSVFLGMPKQFWCHDFQTDGNDIAKPFFCILFIPIWLRMTGSERISSNKANNVVSSRHNNSVGRS